MKIAVLLSGQPRKIEIARESLNYYSDKHECDFFIHSWIDEKFQSSSYKDIIDLFKPKKLFLEQQIIFDDKGIQCPTWRTTLQNLMSMYYSIYMSNQLKSLYEEEKGFKYDFVMRMRTDLKFVRPIEIEKIEKDKIALYKWTETAYDNIGLSDVFALGPSDLMDKYSNVYPNLLYYLNNDPTYVINDSKMRPEYVLKHHVDTACKLPLQKFWHGDHTDNSFHLIR